MSENATQAEPTAAGHEPPETETTKTMRVACDGGGGALGHPRVWLSIDPKTGWVECGYCDKRYVLESD